MRNDGGCPRPNCVLNAVDIGWREANPAVQDERAQRRRSHDRDVIGLQTIALDVRVSGSDDRLHPSSGLERLGYTAGTSVVVDELDTGELRVIPAGKVRRADP